MDHSEGKHEKCTKECKEGPAKPWFSRQSKEKIDKVRVLLADCAVMADALCKMKSTSQVGFLLHNIIYDV